MGSRLDEAGFGLTTTVLAKAGGMEGLNSWDVALFAVAGYIAIMSLVRLMLGRRSALARQIQEDLQRRPSSPAQPSDQTDPNRQAVPPRTPAAPLVKKQA